MSGDESNVGDLLGLGNLADSKLAERVYVDALRGGMQEAGKGVRDIVKTSRWLLAPLTLAAAWHKRFERYCEEIENAVPVERRVEAPPEVAGPALVNMVFTSDTNPLMQLYVELLKRSIDREHQHEIHPAFVKIIEHLSPDEAFIVYTCKRESRISEAFGQPVQTVFPVVERKEITDYQYSSLHSYPIQIPSVCGQFKPYAESLTFKDKLIVYVDHLVSLNLFRWKQMAFDAIKENEIKLGASDTFDWEEPSRLVRTESTQYAILSEFGHSFARACIPDGFSLGTAPL